MRVLPAGVAVLFGVLGAACGPELGAPQMTGCPEQEPIAGGPCDAPMTCTFAANDGGSGCGPSFTCQGFLWEAMGEACPPPPPTTCPANIPSAGAPCKLAGQACTFDVPGTCPGVFVATCSAAGEWAVADDSPSCVPHPCPVAEPVAGTPCDYPFDCTYTVMLSGCAPSTQDATCVSGAWQIDAGPCVP